MATSKYFALTPAADNLNFLDFELSYGNGSISTVGESVQFSGSAKVDSILVRPGLVYDLSSTAGGIDKIYLTGSLSDYKLSTDALNSTLTLSRTVDGLSETVIVARGTSNISDRLIFANGTVSTLDLYDAASTAGPLPKPSLTETSLTPQGAAAPDAHLDATIKAFSSNPAAAGQVGETFASVRPGVNYIVNGGNGIDTVYVADGSTVDATVLGQSVDLVYMRGKWSDYTKSTQTDGTVLVFTRQINGVTETVKVDAGTSKNFDRLIFADGAVTTFNATTAIVGNPNVSIDKVVGSDLSKTTPLYSDKQVAAALATIRDAAEANNATGTAPSLDTYMVAGIKGVTAGNLGAVNDALNSASIKGASVDTAPEVQALVNAYKAILASADGIAGNTATPLTDVQYAAIGVTGVSAATGAGTTLNLLDDVVDRSASAAAVDTVGEVQAMADAAADVLAAAGGTAAQAAALSLSDLVALGVTGVTSDNLVAVQAKIQSATDAAVDTRTEVQGVVNDALGGIAAALNTIKTAAENNSATPTSPDLGVYTAASVSGVTSDNLAAINNALNSVPVTGAMADTTPEVQAIVDAYSAILNSADGVPANTTTPLTGDQFNAIGVTGVSGLAAPANALYLLNSAVDQSGKAAVDTVPELQTMANAAEHVLALAGSAPGDAVPLTLEELKSLGIGGVDSSSLAAVLAAIKATTPDAAIDTQGELQRVVNTALGPVGEALNKIRDAAEANNATSTTPATATYQAAGVSGVTDTGNLSAINSALNSTLINGMLADTTSEVQAIVNAYNAILASADGKGGNTATPLTSAQYTAIGVTGVDAAAGPGTALNLLDDVVDRSKGSAVGTVSEVQAMADAAAHVLAAAGGTAAQAAMLSLEDLTALGITGVSANSLAAVRAKVQSAADAGVDTYAELQGLSDTALNGIATALNTIKNAAENNSASVSTPDLTVYAAASVSGVTADNLAAINTALNSATVTGAQADTTPEVQAIVDAYNAILKSADGTPGNTVTPLVGDQYSAVGVTGISGTAVAGTALSLLNSAVDQSAKGAVDTVPELQTMANAAIDVLALAGSAAGVTVALTIDELKSLGISGVYPSNLVAVLAAIKATTPDSAIDSQGELQRVVNTAIGTMGTALNTIRDAAEANSATASFPDAATYRNAGATTAQDANVAAYNSALDSTPINGVAADTSPEVQAIVNAYNTILSSADGQGDNTGTPLSGAIYTAVGVTGVNGTAVPGSALGLLNDVVDRSAGADVDAVSDLQAMASAANTVMAAAGGSAEQAAALQLKDFKALGVSGVTVDNLAAVQAAIQKTASDAAVDTRAELQGAVDAAVANAATALTTIRDAAQANTAVSNSLATSVYAAAGVTGVGSGSLNAINTALDSGTITGTQADTTEEVQTIVNAYNAILASADGAAGNTPNALTGKQYTDIGVTGVTGTATAGSALALLNSVVDASARTAVDTEAEVQTLANAAAHVMAAAGAAPGDAILLNKSDLLALGVTGVTDGNLAAVIAAIVKTTPDANVDSLGELQGVVDLAAGKAVQALAKISAAAGANNAISSGLDASVYADAGVTGVDSINVVSVDTALDSAAVLSANADTTAEVQAIVNAYKAILDSANSKGGDTSVPLTGSQYKLIGVTGVDGFAAAGNAMQLLNDSVDRSARADVDSQTEVQAKATAAVHVMDAAGGSPTQIAALSATDLTNLGVTGFTADNLPAVRNAIGKVSSDTGVDAVSKLQKIVDDAVTEASNALTAIKEAARLDNANDATPAASVYVSAGVSGVDASNLSSVNSALNSLPITDTSVDASAKAQLLVDSYKAILASADGKGGNTGTALTGAQYNAIGVTGVSGSAAMGNALYLLDDAVDRSTQDLVDAQTEVQAMANAANRVMDAAGGTPTQIAALSVSDLRALGVTGVDAGNLVAVQNAIGVKTSDTAVDTQKELQDIVTSVANNAANALKAIKDAADANNAATVPIAASVYATAGVSGVTDPGNLVSMNSALDSAAVTGASVDSVDKVQALVNAYKAILASADGVLGNTSTSLTGAQYTAVGVTGLSGTATDGTPLRLMDDVVDVSKTAAVDTVPKLQAMATAAGHVMDAAGGTAGQIGTLTKGDLDSLGISNVTSDNLAAVRNAIAKQTSDAAVDTAKELQDIVSTAATAAATALGKIKAAADANNAATAPIAASVYADAGVSGVTDPGNLVSMNSALDSAAIAGTSVDNIAKVQVLVDAYKAILASADGVVGNTTTALTGTQYNAVGVVGVSGTASVGNALYLLDDVVDGSKTAAVDTVPKLQAMATAAGHVMDAAGGTADQIGTLTKGDLDSLGISNVTSDNLAAVRNAIAKQTSDAAVDTAKELQDIVSTAATAAATALGKIKAAADANNAATAPIAASVYADAGVSGVTDPGNLVSMNSALDSAAIAGTSVDSIAKVQVLVDAYKAILASADGVVGNTTTALTGTQYNAVGVVGVSGTASVGNALYLLDDVVDGSKTAAVDTVPKLQAMATAAGHVMDAAGGTAGQIGTLTKGDLDSLGISNVTSDNLAAVRNAIAKQTSDAAVDTAKELQDIVSTAATAAATALVKIKAAADANNAATAPIAASVYADAGVSGVSDTTTLGAVNSALDSAFVTGTVLGTVADVQSMVDAYKAILASADGVAGSTPLTGAQYTAVGVTGLSGTATDGTTLHLLDDVVDVSAAGAVDSVPELQALSVAASHVIGAAAGGTALTIAELGLLGINGVKTDNFAAVMAAIAGTADNGFGVDTKAELQKVVDDGINSAPNLQTALGGTTNLDVTSNLVFTVDRTVTKGTGFIHIKDLGGNGFHGDTSTNSQDIDISTALGQSLVSIVGTGTNTKIIINPTWDLDLASNYEITFDKGVFVDSAGHQSAAIPAIKFSTVAPGGHGLGTLLSEAAASKVMNDSTGAMDSGRLWLDIEGVGNATGVMTQFGDLSKGAYALALKNYATVPGGPIGNEGGIDGMYAHDTNVGVDNFGIDDIVYFDSQANDLSKQKLDLGYVQFTDGGKVSGGLPGQNLMTLGATPDSQAGSAYVGLGLEGNTAKTIYLAVHAIDSTPGWADVYHKGSEPLIMG